LHHDDGRREQPVRDVQGGRFVKQRTVKWLAVTATPKFSPSGFFVGVFYARWQRLGFRQLTSLQVDRLCKRDGLRLCDRYVCASGLGQRSGETSSEGEKRDCGREKPSKRQDRAILAS
jgi:hypothetical protein